MFPGLISAHRGQERFATPAKRATLGGCGWELSEDGANCGKGKGRGWGEALSLGHRGSEVMVRK